MEADLDIVKGLGGAKHLVPAEELIMSAVRRLDPYYEKLTDEDMTNFEKCLLSLFLVNSGDISPQCSIYIASKLLIVYRRTQKAKLIDMVSFAIQSWSTATIIATGYLCRRMSDRNKSQLPRFIDHILKNGRSFPFASLFALHACMKAGGRSVHEYSVPVFGLATSFAALSGHVTGMALKLLQVLNGFQEIPVTSMIESARMFLTKGGDAPFVRDGVALLVARCVLDKHIKSMEATSDTKADEWAIGAKKNVHMCDFGWSLTVIESFPSILETIFVHVIETLGPEIVSVNHAQLFAFVREKIPDAIATLIPLLPGDSRSTYFNVIAKEKVSVSQLRLLSALGVDDSNISVAAKIALKLGSSRNRKERKAGAAFFASIGKTYPFVAEGQLRKALTQLDGTNGAGLAAKAIIANLPDKKSIIITLKTEIQGFLKNCFATSPGSPKFVDAFELLTVLPKGYAISRVVTRAVDSVIAMEDPSQALVRAIFAFRAKHIALEQNKRLVDWVFRRRPTDIPKSVLRDLCSIVPKIADGDGITVTAVNAILAEVVRCKPSRSLVKSFFRRPLPLASELVGMKERTSKTDSFVNVVIRKFPVLVVACPPQERGSIIKSVLEPHKQNTTTLLLCASMCESKITRKSLPLNLHHYLLSILVISDISLVQPCCESIALFAKYHTNTLHDIFLHVEKHPGTATCVLLSAIFSHASISAELITRALIFINGQLKNGTTCGVAVQAITSLIATHSMRLSCLNVATSNQFPVLFRVIHSTAALQPVTMALIGACFKILIETFSSELAIPGCNFLETAILALKSIEMTPTSYAREIHYDCCRAVYTFAQSMMSSVSMTFPNNWIVGWNKRLAASEAYATRMQFQLLDIKVEETLSGLLQLLQMTGDDRAACFIRAIASLTCVHSLDFWIANIRRILVTSSLSDVSTMSIEPSLAVKKVAIESLAYVIEEVAKAKVLVAEHIDDIVASLCRVAEAGCVQLQDASFPVLQRVIVLFRDRKNGDGGRVLDVCDSQLSSAVKAGFQLPLSVSGAFLSTCLTFNTDNMSKDPENCSSILAVYLNGLECCRERTSSFYSLAAHLCSVGRRYAQIRPLVQSFLVTMTPIFADVVLQAMALRRPETDWRQINDFRILARGVYEELLPSFVWLQTVSETIIDVDVLMSFFVIEMSYGREEWMVNAAFEALNVTIDICGGQLSSDMLELAVRTALGFSGTNERQLLVNASACLTNDSSWDSLRECVLSLAIANVKSFSPVTLARILRSDDRKSLSKYSLAIAHILVDHYSAGAFNANSANALFTIMFRHSPSIVTAACEYCFTVKGLPVSFKLMMIELGCKIAGSDLRDFGGIPRYLLATFKKGGMHLVGQLMNVCPDVGTALFARGCAKAAFILAFQDAGNVRAYLWFIQLGLLTLERCDPKLSRHFASSVFRLAAAVVHSCGLDPSNGHSIVFHCIRVMLDVHRISGSAGLSRVYSEEDRSSLCHFFERHIADELQQRKMQALVEFSTNDRSHRQNQWTTLEISDSS